MDLYLLVCRVRNQRQSWRPPQEAGTLHLQRIEILNVKQPGKVTLAAKSPHGTCELCVMTTAADVGANNMVERTDP